MTALDRLSPTDTVLVMEVAGRPIGVHIADVDEVQAAAALTPLSGAPAVIDGVLDLGGDVVPVIDARRRLGLTPREIRPTDRFVIVHTAARRLALRVDATIGFAEVDGVDLADAASLMPDVLRRAGIVRSHDGLLVAVEPDTFLSAEEAVGLDQALAELENQAAG